MRISDWSSDVCSSDLPEALRAFLDALIRAGELIQEDPDRAVQVVAESSGTDIDVIQEGFDFMEDTIAYDARVNPEGLQWTIDLVADYASLDPVPTVDDLYDDSLLP